MKGINSLKKLNINIDYGFMLFQPSSTYFSIYENLNFLKKLCSDGYMPVKFLKMMPYFDTRVEKDLRNEDRLKGIPGFYDYDFLISSLNHYYDFIKDSFIDWIAGAEGLVNISIWAGNYISVFSHFYKVTSRVKSLSDKVRNTVAQSNMFFLDTMKELAIIFESGKYDPVNNSNLTGYKIKIKNNHELFKEQIFNTIHKVYRIAEYQLIEQVIS
jgi:hypothetical protein